MPRTEQTSEFDAIRTRGQTHSGATRELKSIEQFRANPTYAGDGTRIDLAYSIYALAHGASESAVSEVIRSRDLSHKGNEERQAKYVDRTIRKVLSVVGGQVASLQR
jgi:hypothetical protein